MKLVVVGGQGRKVGKTSVIAGLIRGLNTLAWTAVKISHHAGDTGTEDPPWADDLPVSATIRSVGPGLAPAQSVPRGGPTVDLGHDHVPAPVGAMQRVAPTPKVDLERHDLPAHLDFLLSEERDAKGHGDTALYLAAGARRALWLRTRGGGLARALPGLLEALGGDEHVIVESNSLLGFLKPDIFLMVIDQSGREVKASARQFLTRADAFVTVGAGPRLRPARAWPLAPDKPVFAVWGSEWSSAALCSFVSERLAKLPRTMKTPPHPNSPHPLSSSLGRGKRGRG